MIKNGKYFVHPYGGDGDFKTLFARVAAAGVGRPADKDGCPQGPWTPDLLAEAISQIDANCAGIELRTVQLWFEDNEKGISANNIRWLARVLGCNDPEAASAWQAELSASQTRLTARRRARRQMDARREDNPPVEAPSERRQAEESRGGFSLARLSEGIFSRGSLLNLPASVFAGAVALQFVSCFLSLHSVTYVLENGITKQVGFLWAPNWTFLVIVFMLLFFAFAVDQVTTWKNGGRATLLSHISENDRLDGWMQAVEASSYTYWAVFLLCFGFAGVFQWVSVRLLPVLNGGGDYAMDWGSLALARPDEIGVIEQVAFTGAAYLYMCLCFYLFVAGLILLSTVAEDFAQIGKTLERQPNAASARAAQAAGSRIMRGIFRCTVAGFLVAMCMKLESLYVVTAAPSVWHGLFSDAGSTMIRFGEPVDWGDYGMPTHFTSLLVALMVGAVYLYGAIRISLTTPFHVPMARTTTAVLFLVLVYLLIGVVTGFSILLALGIIVAIYGLFDPGFGARYEWKEDRRYVS